MDQGDASVPTTHPHGNSGDVDVSGLKDQGDASVPTTHPHHARPYARYLEP